MIEEAEERASERERKGGRVREREGWREKGRVGLI